MAYVNFLRWQTDAGLCEIRGEGSRGESVMMYWRWWWLWGGGLHNNLRTVHLVVALGWGGLHNNLRTVHL